ncbi:MAG: undecaprenyl-diphosphatase UppP [Armatimonadetes bacterium]|nr:undecaprenyl-diphosphatase UppP [Armatimonadota bacterium]
MDWFEALIIGIVQGLTEFLPISSTAHVRLVPELLGWSDPGAAFTAVIQLGTLLAVLVYFREDLSRAIGGWVRGIRGGEAARTPEARLGWAVFWGTIPAVVLGVLLKDYIEGDFRSLYVICGSLIGVGILMATAEVIAKHRRKLESVKPADGWAVGFWQALALVPGVSRSGSTITGALFLGFDRATAARFSFLLSVPAILLAGIYELIKERERLVDVGIAPVVIATFAAFAVGYLSIGFLLRFLRTRSTAVFIVYRFALAALLLFLLANGTLKPHA